MMEDSERSSPGDSAPKNAVTRTLRVDALVLDKTMQARSKLNEATVADYARVYQDGEGLPPITVAMVDGVPLVVDGWHRVAALRHIGRDRVEAEVVEASKAEALYLAMMANLRHGLPLRQREKNKALRRALGAYLRARKHLKGQGQCRSLREITADLGNHVSHNTVRKWLWEDHPRLAERWWGHDPLPSPGGDGPPQKPQVFSPGNTCADSISNALAAFQGVHNPVERGELIARMEEALEKMKEGGDWEVYSPDF